MNAEQTGPLQRIAAISQMLGVELIPNETLTPDELIISDDSRRVQYPTCTDIHTMLTKITWIILRRAKDAPPKESRGLRLAAANGKLLPPT